MHFITHPDRESRFVGHVIRPGRPIDEEYSPKHMFCVVDRNKHLFAYIVYNFRSLNKETELRKMLWL